MNINPIDSNMINKTGINLQILVFIISFIYFHFLSVLRASKTHCSSPSNPILLFSPGYINKNPRRLIFCRIPSITCPTLVNKSIYFVLITILFRIKNIRFITLPAIICLSAGIEEDAEENKNNKKNFVNNFFRFHYVRN
jgi:hypothetical protein